MDNNLVFNVALIGGDPLTGEITDRRGCSVREAGEYLRLAARCVLRGGQKPTAATVVLASVLEAAATIALTAEPRSDDGKAISDEEAIAKETIEVLAKGFGLKAGWTRHKAPPFAVVAYVRRLQIEQDLAKTQAVKAAAKKFGVSKTSVYEYCKQVKKLESEQGDQAKAVAAELKRLGMNFR